MSNNPKEGMEYRKVHPFDRFINGHPSRSRFIIYQGNERMKLAKK